MAARDLQFPPIDNRRQTTRDGNRVLWNKPQTKIDYKRSLVEKIQMIHGLNFSMFYDSEMIKYITTGDRDKKGGVKRTRNEDDYVECYDLFAETEAKIQKNNPSSKYQIGGFLDVTKILSVIRQALHNIKKMRKELYSINPYNSYRSARIGELKRNARFLITYYIKMREGLLDIEYRYFDLNLLAYERMVEDICFNVMNEPVSIVKAAMAVAA